MKVVESYSLVENKLPTIPVPHDCVIKEIALNEDWLIMTFEDDIFFASPFFASTPPRGRLR